MKLLGLIALAVGCASGEEMFHVEHQRLWSYSVAAVGVSTAMDSASSWGRPEMNPVLGSRFDAGAEVVKFGIVGMIISSEWLLRRKIPLHKWAWVNFAVAGATSGVAVRNWRTQ